MKFQASTVDAWNFIINYGSWLSNNQWQEDVVRLNQQKNVWQLLRANRIVGDFDVTKVTASQIEHLSIGGRYLDIHRLAAR